MIKPGSRHVFHLYVIRTENRDQVQRRLNDAGVETAIHYPTALPFLPCYSHLNPRPESFPVAYAYQNKILSLPLFPELREEEIAFVAALLN
jgi:dTDP-4-amino-4,6-dideoxygalactose transaminase